MKRSGEEKISDVLGLSEEEFNELWDRYFQELCEIMIDDKLTECGKKLMEWAKEGDEFAKFVFLAQQLSISWTFIHELMEKISAAKLALITLASELEVPGKFLGYFSVLGETIEFVKKLRKRRRE